MYHTNQSKVQLTKRKIKAEQVWILVTYSKDTILGG